MDEAERRAIADAEAVELAAAQASNEGAATTAAEQGE
jgi:DNA-directed RNA polymerase subunit beta'